MISVLRRLRSDQISGLVLVALAVFVGWQNRDYPVGSLSDPGPGYTPLLICVFLGAMGLLVALRGGRSPRLGETRWPEAKRAAIILGACSLATWAFEPIGYRITIAALIVFFLGVLERRHPLAVIAVAAGFSLLTFYLIGDVLHVPLPVGRWGY